MAKSRSKKISQILRQIDSMDVIDLARFLPRQPNLQQSWKTFMQHLEQWLNRPEQRKLLMEALDRLPPGNGPVESPSGPATVLETIPLPTDLAGPPVPRTTGFGAVIGAYRQMFIRRHANHPAFGQDLTASLRAFWAIHRTVAPLAHAKRQARQAAEAERNALRNAQARQQAAEQAQVREVQRLQKEETARLKAVQDRLQAIQASLAFWDGLRRSVATGQAVRLEHVDQILQHPEHVLMNDQGEPIGPFVGKNITVLRALKLLGASPDNVKSVQDEIQARTAQARRDAVVQKEQATRAAQARKEQAVRDAAARKEQQQLAREEEQTRRAAHRAWDEALIHAADMPAALGITKTEYLRWREDKRIPITTTRAFRKWGRELQAALHHPDDLVHITPALIAGWRTDHRSATTARRQAGAQKAAIARAWPRLVTRMAEQGFSQLEPTAPVWRWEVEITVLIGPRAIPCLLAAEGRCALPFSQSTLDSLPERLQAMAQRFDIAQAQTHVQAEVNRAIREMGLSPEALLPDDAADRPVNVPPSASLPSAASPSALQPSTPDASSARTALHGRMLNALIASMRRGTPCTAVHHAHLKRAMEQVIASEQRQVGLDQLLSRFNLHHYPESFPLARQTRRHVHLVLGPTNAGKTHGALEALRAASSGVYLAPLRLLAMEVYDRLTAAGVPCDLRTGEEHIQTPGARHVCATVEMMDPSTAVDVAVIDECQMVADDHRGSGWTAALTGVPAQQVFAIGANAVEPMVVALIEHLGEPLTVEHNHRKTPLSVLSGAVTRYNLEPGDAVIAFSRREVLQISEELQDRGFSVATIYGALSPEVRRAQAALFSSGQAEVIVATDAIGMGMNLPIRRVLFHATSKYDGVEVRPLNVPECLQIGGRAGRFGLHDRGYVGAFSAGDLAWLKESFETVPDPLCERFPIGPTLTYVQQIGQRLNRTALVDVLREFLHLPFSHNLFEKTIPENLMAWAHVVDRHGRDLPLETRFAYVHAPLNADRHADVEQVVNALNHHRQKRPMPLPALPDWIREGRIARRRLEEAETLDRHLGFYAWLSLRFPMIFPDQVKVPAQRRRVASAIGHALRHPSSPSDQRQPDQARAAFFSRTRSLPHLRQLHQDEALNQKSNEPIGWENDLDDDDRNDGDGANRGRSSSSRSNGNGRNGSADRSPRRL